MSATEDDLTAWMKSGEYLPPALRDFREQKDVFKAVHELVERARAGNDTHVGALSWTQAHVYTVDFFLWYMARRGFTLQRSRKPLPYRDLSADVSESRCARDAATAGAFRLLRARVQPRPQTCGEET